MIRTLFATLVLLASTLGTACSNDGPAALRAAAPVAELFPLKVGEVTLQVQVPLTDAELARGLMFRDSLDPDHGMIFCYREPGQKSFWMNNVPIPLDIGFFDSEGVLREIRSMFAYDRRSVISSRSDVRYALEVNKGWYQRNNILPGARIDLADLASALKARGATAADYVSK